MTSSSSVPAWPACTSSIASDSSACRSGCSRPVAAWAAPGTGIAILGRGSIRRATPTAIRFRRRSCRNGTGGSISPRSRKRSRYLEFVADRFDLRRDIQFDSRVAGATYDESGNALGRSFSRMAAGARGAVPDHGDRALSRRRLMPNIQGMRVVSAARLYHTGQWPHIPWTFAGKRVGRHRDRRNRRSGDPGSREDRRPSHRLPALAELLRAAAQSADRRGDQLEIKASYPEIFERCRESHGCFLHKTDLRKALEVTPEEREAFYEKLYGEPGFGIWMGELPRHPDRSGRERHHQRVHPAQDSRTGHGIPRPPKS